MIQLLVAGLTVGSGYALGGLFALTFVQVLHANSWVALIGATSCGFVLGPRVRTARAVAGRALGRDRTDDRDIRRAGGAGRDRRTGRSRGTPAPARDDAAARSPARRFRRARGSRAGAVRGTAARGRRCDEALRRIGRARRRVVSLAAGDVDLAHRPQRCGEDDAVQRGVRDRPSERRDRRDRRGRRERLATASRRWGWAARFRTRVCSAR